MMQVGRSVIASVATVILFIAATTAEERIVTLENGSPLVGTTEESPFGGGHVDQFLGIPYAEPPIGNLRFRAPVAKAPWNDVKQRVIAPPACVQSVYPTDMSMIRTWWRPSIAQNMQEDCLYLNVWVPTGVTAGDKMPVMLWIHGGGFYAGSATPELYDGRVLSSSQRVIVVSIQYRLGIFGFAYLDPSWVPGNMGLLDQVLALKWVHDNVANFGGDPSKVTIFGQSAGSTSVGYHLLSPLSRPYFAGAILQSGSASSPWALLHEDTVRLRTLETVIRLGCEMRHSTSSGMLECLRSASTMDLLMKSFLMPDVLGLMWGPIVDGSFLPKSINKMLYESESKNISILLGSNQREFNMFFPTLLPTVYNLSLIRNTSHVLNSDDELYYIKDALIPSRIKSLPYFKQESDLLYPVDQQNREETLDEIFGDISFTCPTHQLARFYTGHGLSASYVYNFQYHSPSSLYQTPSWMGALHGDELPFVFGVPFNSVTSAFFTDDERSLSLTIMKYWANYAKTGDPNESGDSTTPSLATWYKYNVEGRSLIIQSDMAIRAGRIAGKLAKCQFWRGVIPELPMWSNVV